jgi:hypothetical protein
MTTLALHPSMRPGLVAESTARVPGRGRFVGFQAQYAIDANATAAWATCTTKHRLRPSEVST